MILAAFPDGVSEMHVNGCLRARWLTTAILAAMIAGAAPQHAHAETDVTVRVSPRMCVERCDARITVRIEADEDNRALIVEADSPEYSRRSRIQLDGGEAPLVHTLRLRSLPSATYQIRVTLMRADEEKHETMSLIVSGAMLR